MSGVASVEMRVASLEARLAIMSKEGRRAIDAMIDQGEDPEAFAEKFETVGARFDAALKQLQAVRNFEADLLEDIGPKIDGMISEVDTTTLALRMWSSNAASLAYH